MLLRDKVAIITGGSRGIGKSIALKFCEEGCSIVIADILKEEGERVRREILQKGRDVLYIRCDVTKAQDVNNMVNQVINRFGKIDILVNNAGGLLYPPANSIMGITEEQWDDIVNLNLKSVFLCCRAVVPHMKLRKYGKIINISAMGVLSPPEPGTTAYIAAKAGVIGLTIDLACELAQLGINVNAILPGPIRTALFEIVTKDVPDKEAFFQRLAKDKVPMQRIGSPEDVAGAALYLASELSSYVTGALIPVSGGIPLPVYH